MKEIIETKMVEQTTVKFIASDGEIFVGDDARYQCSSHERTLDKTAAQAELIKMGAKIFDMPFGSWIGFDYDLCLVELKSEEDFILFKAALNKVYDPYENTLEAPKSYPSKMICSISSDDVYIVKMSEQSFKTYLQECRDLLAFDKINDFITVPESPDAP